MTCDHKLEVKVKGHLDILDFDGCKKIKLLHYKIIRSFALGWKTFKISSGRCIIEISYFNGNSMKITWKSYFLGINQSYEPEVTFSNTVFFNSYSIFSRCELERVFNFFYFTFPNSESKLWMNVSSFCCTL